MYSLEWQSRTYCVEAPTVVLCLRKALIAYAMIQAGNPPNEFVLSMIG